MIWQPNLVNCAIRLTKSRSKAYGAVSPVIEAG